MQHCFREGRQVAFVGAGLPEPLRRLLTDPYTTFLRRAERIHLGSITRGEARAALQEPIETSGLQIAPAALDAAVRGSRGYPFLVQLVGYQAWKGAHDDHDSTIKLPHVQAAVTAAIRRSNPPQRAHDP